MQRQKIRPSYGELKRFEDENGDGGESDDDTPEYAPAATPYRRAPPLVLARSETSAPRASSSNLGRDESLSSEVSYACRKLVRIAESDLNETRLIESNNQDSHFGSLNQYQRNRDLVTYNEIDQDLSHRAAPKAGAAFGPLIGIVQERNGLVKNINASEGKKLSRFASSRQKDRQIAVASNDDTHYTTDSNEVWLDEEGQPMSAFRRSHLRNRGQRPPTVRNKDIAEDKQQQVNGATLHPATETTSASMKSVSDQNDAKVAAMSIEEIEESLQQLKETFGSDLLEKLRKRKKGGEAGNVVNITEDTSEITVRKPRKTREDQDLETIEDLRIKYFPNEPRELPSSLRWTREPEEVIGSKTDILALRFDFSGSLIPYEKQKDSELRLAGLHHHGEEQHRAGYTIDELLHLARSTLPSQSILALQTLDRIVSKHPERGRCTRNTAVEIVSQNLIQHNVRGKAAVIASWFIENHQISLRRVAIRCLQACLITTLAGPDPVLGVVNELIEPKAEYDIYSEQLGLALVPLLAKILSQDDQMQDDLDLTLSILVFLCKRSVRICNAVIQHLSSISSIVSRCILQPSWPPLEKDKLPSPNALTLLLCIISSSRQNATLLVKEKYIDVLLRFLAIPPWKISMIKGQKDVWIYYDLTMQIYNALASYGIYTDVVKRSHILITQILDWISNDRQDFQVTAGELSAMSITLRCMDCWTICAMDPHQTVCQHDIEWSQVFAWGDYALECIQSASRKVYKASENDDKIWLYIGVATDALQLLNNWITCATKYKQISKVELQEYVDKALSSISSIGQCWYLATNFTMNDLSARITSANGEPLWINCLSKLKQLTQECRSAEVIIIFLKRKPTTMSSKLSPFMEFARKLISGAIWPALDGEEARQNGFDLLRQDLISFCSTILFANVEVPILWPGMSLFEVLSLIRLVRNGQENIVQHLIEDVLPRLIQEWQASDLVVLKPFYVELIRSRRLMQTECPHFISSKSLPKTQTLFFNVEKLDPDNNDRKEIDPISGAILWKSSQSGLPLRLDWPIAAIDDLLHSGNCASLNRPDALKEDWDANERQIVISSLRVAATLWQQTKHQGIKEDNINDVLPSVAEVHLAIIKVFLLEDEQDQTSKGTGIITGKDLFRDDQIAPLMEQLFMIAKQVPIKDDEMEKVAKRQFGTSLPFYQMYTSLIGLYDSISFGMELFGRAVMLPQTNHYATDYRRLLWIDYAHCLSSIEVTLGTSPCINLDDYLIVEGANKEIDIVQAMIYALVTKSINKVKNELIWHIAIQQVAHLIWYDDSTSDLKKMIAKSLFRSSADLNEVNKTILEYFKTKDEGRSRKQEVIQERRAWLRNIELLF